MIYSFVVFGLLILKNYLNKKQKFLCDSLIIQVTSLCLYENGHSILGFIIGIFILGEMARKLEIGNHDGNRKY